MTRFAEAVRRALETFARMAAWEKLGLLIVFIGGIFVAGLFIYTQWFPKEMREVMQQNFRLTETVEELKGKNTKLQVGFGNAIEAGKEKDLLNDRITKQLKAAQGAAEKDRQAKEAVDAALLGSQQTVKSLREQLAVALKKDNPDAVAEITRLTKELSERDRKFAEVDGQKKSLDTSLSAAQKEIQGLKGRLTTLEVPKDAIIGDKDKRITELEEKNKLLAQQKESAPPPVWAPPPKAEKKLGTADGLEFFATPEVKKKTPKASEAAPEQRPIGVGPFFRGRNFRTCTDVRGSCERGKKAYVGVCTERFNACMSSGCWYSHHSEGHVCRLAKR